jgi:putative transcription factor
VEDYGRKLRDAMASQGISRKDFAQRIGERENLVARIESQKIIPEMKVIQKIERELEISLTEEPEEVKISDFVSSSSATTLGSVARIKRKKKTET